MISLLTIFALSALGALGDTFIKLAGQHSPAQLGWLFLGAVVYMLTVPGWLFVMRNVPLTAVGALYAGSSVLILVGVGVVGFRERLTFVEGAGLLLVIAAIALLRRLL